MAKRKLKGEKGRRVREFIELAGNHGLDYSPTLCARLTGVNIDYCRRIMYADLRRVKAHV